MPKRNLGDTGLPQLPAPDDFLAIQRGIGEVLRLLATDALPDRRAQTLLRGLAAASANLARHHRREEKLAAQAQTHAATHPEAAPARPNPVTDYINHPTHGTLAPDPNAPEATGTETPVPDPIPLFTPDASPNTTYDEAKMVALHQLFTQTFTERYRTLLAQKEAGLEARYALLQTEFEDALELEYQARLASAIQTLTTQNQDFTQNQEKPETTLALAS